jgi:hypothetical protein
MAVKKKAAPAQQAAAAPPREPLWVVESQMLGHTSRAFVEAPDADTAAVILRREQASTIASHIVTEVLRQATGEDLAMMQRAGIKSVKLGSGTGG